MQQKLDSLIEELNGVDLVLGKLESKTNVSVFEKLCANCNRIFSSFCEFDIKDVVSSGLGKKSIDFLTRLKGQVIRLKNYKEAITEYIKMSESNQFTVMPTVSQIQEQTNVINNQFEKRLELQNPEGKAA
ncbi:MAG: hypothetical protein J1F35_02480 [Erysipelotrichales bacterium]|nr:hypothetical protein [Erysipelotrichales bacterium]